ncbi:hypothetical protein WSS_A07754 [Rhodococcus opacus M213]|uniref:Uncharacterized protein n=1 Tax=Rhodococcus opacus M213 TaxID=1129896 RepID=K8Y199_RHOOP|nr:hypothetical protein [Rhodococcus opacus]EKT83360.1 hypothetical protein WSS_A07754 [Rhodococcus opacus M213]
MGVPGVSRGRSDSYWEHRVAIEAHRAEFIVRAESTPSDEQASIVDHYDQSVRVGQAADTVPGEQRD